MLDHVSLQCWIRLVGRTLKTEQYSFGNQCTPGTTCSWWGPACSLLPRMVILSRRRQAHLAALLQGLREFEEWQHSKQCIELVGIFVCCFPAEG